ncbi:MAG TPA: xanthine dehydrogenase family protein subunit M [Rhizomicrobium sp.]|nr:xanthine dehydrogenase family protein subunit M [Rhizomicrobium sp.]
MIPYQFGYHRPGSIAQAQALFSRLQDARFLAGGQTLIPVMKQRLANPAHLIDLSRIGELSFVAAEHGAIAIGGGVRHFQVESSPEIRRAIPALAGLAGTIGDPAVRHLGTLGGSLANNDPAADYPAAVLGLGATIATTNNVISADKFFSGMFQTALEEGEIIKTVSFPIPLRAGYAKFPNPASRYAIVGVFVAQTHAGVRVAVTGAAPCVFRAAEMERALSARFEPHSLSDVKVSSNGLNSDLHASADYRAHLVTVMAKRAVAAALDGPSSPTRE